LTRILFAVIDMETLNPENPKLYILNPFNGTQMEELIQLGCWPTSTMEFRSPHCLMECMNKENKV
jgi:hypothetical protein